MILFFLSCVILAKGSVAELSADIVFDLLSRRIDDVKFENKILKLKLEDAVKKMTNHVDKIDNMEKVVTEMDRRVAKLEKKGLEFEKGISDRKEDELKNQTHVTERSEFSVKLFEGVKEQSALVHKMLSSEKTFLRRMLKNFDNKFVHFKNEMQLETSSVNASFSTLSSKTDQKLESFQQEMENEANRNVKSIADNSNELQTLKGKIAKIEAKQVTKGGWGTWTGWTDCSVTCNGGIQSRQRQCDNPRPTAGGQDCAGSSLDIQTCGKQQCPRKLLAFTAMRPSNKDCFILEWLNIIIFCDIRFNDILLNEGSHYLNGTFTCLYPGLYHFEANLTAKDKRNHLNCKILKNGNQVIVLDQQNPVRALNGTLSTAGSVNLHLVKGDEVNIRCEHDGNQLYSTSTFSGFLISADLL